MSISRNKLILIIAGVVAAAGLGYYFFFFTASPDATVTASAPASAAELTFVNLAGQLDPIDFDTTLLNDPRFMALVDIRTAVIPEASGRHDPFAPIPGVPTGKTK